MNDHPNTLQNTVDWFVKAKPLPTTKDLSTQIGVHLEEVSEMMEKLTSSNPLLQFSIKMTAETLAQMSKAMREEDCISIKEDNRVEILDALCDQIVTAVGVAHCAGMKIVDGLHEVNRSNWSKFDENGEPILDETRKIIKGPNYTKPDLTLLV